MAPLKLVVTWHLKACCYTTPFTKPVATRQYFTKSQNHFYKTQIIIWQLFQILIWHLFHKSPNTNLTLFYKAQIIIWQLFFSSPNIILATISQSLKYYFGKNNYFILKAQMLFWHMLTKLKYYFWRLLYMY